MCKKVITGCELFSLVFPIDTHSSPCCWVSLLGPHPSCACPPRYPLCVPAPQAWGRVLLQSKSALGPPLFTCLSCLHLSERRLSPSCGQCGPGPGPCHFSNLASCHWLPCSPGSCHPEQVPTSGLLHLLASPSASNSLPDVKARLG